MWFKLAFYYFFVLRIVLYMSAAGAEQDGHVFMIEISIGNLEIRKMTSMTLGYFKQAKQKMAGHCSCFAHVYVNSFFKLRVYLQFVYNSWMENLSNSINQISLYYSRIMNTLTLFSLPLVLFYFLARASVCDYSLFRPLFIQRDPLARVSPFHFLPPRFHFVSFFFLVVLFAQLILTPNLFVDPEMS